MGRKSRERKSRNTVAGAHRQRHGTLGTLLPATALGLNARPFGGVFDGLLNQDLGLDERQEQFLLAVLIGHAGGTDGR